MPKKKEIIVRTSNIEGAFGDINSHQYVTINEDGTLEVRASDTGEYPNQVMGGDYEYWIEVSASSKDDLLLLLIAKAFQESENIVDTFREFLEQNNIPHKFDNWVWID